MKPQQFLDVAKTWKETAYSCEGHRRSLISRAYYAAFHACKQIAIELDLELPNGNSHERLIDALRTHHLKELRQLGNRLNDLKNMRVRSDYRLMDTIYPGDIHKCLSHAEKILASCNQQLKAKANP